MEAHSESKMEEKEGMIRVLNVCNERVWVEVETGRLWFSLSYASYIKRRLGWPSHGTNELLAIMVMLLSIFVFVFK